MARQLKASKPRTGLFAGVWRRYRRSPLARRMLLAILVVSSLGALLATIAQLSVDYRRDVAQVEADLEALQKTTSGTLAYHLWVVNPDAIRHQLADMLRLPNLRYVEVVEDDGTVYRAGRPVADHAELVGKTFKLEYTHPFTGEVLLLGAARLEASTEDIRSRLFDRFLVILVAQGIKTFIVSVFILFVFQWLVTRHLRRITEQARRVNYLTLREPLNLERDIKDDELSELVEAFNQMRRNLLNDIEIWERAEKQLGRENALNTATLMALPEPVVRTDNRGYITLINLAASAVTGWELNEARGMNLSEVLASAPGLISLSAERLLVDMQTSGLALRRERIVFVARNGTTVACAGSATPLRDEKGHFLGALLCLPPVTERQVQGDLLRG